MGSSRNLFNLSEESVDLTLACSFFCSGDVAVLNASDPQTWVMEQVLSGAGGRTLATNRGHTDIVRCAHLNTEVQLSSLFPAPIVC